MTTEEKKKYDAAIDIIKTCKKAFEKLGATDMPKILNDFLVRADDSLSKEQKSYTEIN